MAEDLWKHDSPDGLRARLVAECRIEAESALYSSTSFYIWLRFLRAVRAVLWVAAALSGVIAAARVLQNDPSFRVLTAGAALAGVLLPALIRALQLDKLINAYAQAAAKFKILQGEFRRAADIWAAKPEPDFEREVRASVRAMNKVKSLSLTPPEWCFERAQKKIKRGDYQSDAVPAAGSK